MLEELRATVFDNELVLLSTDYRVQITFGDGKTEEYEISLKSSDENQLTWSRENGVTYIFDANSQGEYILTKSSSMGGSGPIAVSLDYEEKVFIWIEIRSRKKYIFTPIEILDK